MQKLLIDKSLKYLKEENGTPFFLLADTAWELIHRLSREDIDLYLKKRKEQGFNSFFTVIISEDDGLRKPNFYDSLPFEDCNPDKPSESYFNHVDYVVNKAEEYGMYVGLLPTWGDKVGPALFGSGPVVFNAENARKYGRFLGERYDNNNIIWILGGDRNPDSPDRKKVWNAMAAGIIDGRGDTPLMSFHPQGAASSTPDFNSEDWLGFNMCQTGHQKHDSYNNQLVVESMSYAPLKPILESEAVYEYIPRGFYIYQSLGLDIEKYKTINEVKDQLIYGVADDVDVRRAAIISVLSGSCGFVYGHNCVWQMYEHGKESRILADIQWHEALDFPGAWQMNNVKQFFERNNFILLTEYLGKFDNNGSPVSAKSRDFELFYSPVGEPVWIPETVMVKSAEWTNPSDGETFEALPQGLNNRVFIPPSFGRGNDWLLKVVYE